jgi:hypothetical protein
MNQPGNLLFSPSVVCLMVFVCAAKLLGLFDLLSLIPAKKSYLFCLMGKKMALSKVAYGTALAAR